MPTVTLFDNDTPATEDVGADSPVTLATHVVALADCEITHLRFYKHANNTGTHVGAIYPDYTGYAPGAALAEVEFVGETADGWQEQALDTPLQIKKGQALFLAVHMPNGHWSQTAAYFVRGEAGSTGTVRDADYGGILFPRPVGEPSNDGTAIELGTRVTFSEETTVTHIACLSRHTEPGGFSIDLTAHVWDDEGNLLATKLLEDFDTNYGRWAIIELDTPLVCAAGDYVVSVHNSVGQYFGSSRLFDGNSYTRYGHTFPADDAGGGAPNGVYDYNGTADVFPEDTFNQQYYSVDLLTDKSPKLGTWLPTNGGSFGNFDYEQSGSTVAYPDQVSAGLPGSGTTSNYFIDAIFSFGDVVARRNNLSLMGVGR